jgi:hypothetical protein
MTVKELRELLEDMNGDYQVLLELYDDDGDMIYTDIDDLGWENDIESPKCPSGMAYVIRPAANLP